MKDNILEVGDELFRYVGFHNSGMTMVGKIDRVTKTLAFIGDLKVKREMRMGLTSKPGATGWSYTVYCLVTDEVREKIKAQDIRRELMKPLVTLIDSGREQVNRLTNYQLERINAVLGESHA